MFLFINYEDLRKSTISSTDCHAITSLIGIFIIPSQYLKYESCLDILQITLFLNMQSEFS